MKLNKFAIIGILIVAALLFVYASPLSTFYGDYNINGHVIDGVTNGAVSGAKVSVYDPQYGEILDVYTDSDGYFSVAVYNPQWYRVIVSAEGYGTDEVFLWSENPANVVKLYSGPDDPTISYVRGHITDQITGNVVSGVLVSIKSNSEGDTPMVVYTDSDGYFETINYLGQTSYTALIVKNGYETQNVAINADFDNQIVLVQGEVVWDTASYIIIAIGIIVAISVWFVPFVPPKLKLFISIASVILAIMIAYLMIVGGI